MTIEHWGLQLKKDGKYRVIETDFTGGWFVWVCMELHNILGKKWQKQRKCIMFYAVSKKATIVDSNRRQTVYLRDDFWQTYSENKKPLVEKVVGR